MKNGHIRDTLILATPLIIAQVGHIVTGMVDNVFLGKFFGETEQAAGIISNQIFVLLLVFDIGVSLALTPLIASSVVNGNDLEKASLLKNSLFLVPLISVILFIILYFSAPVLNYMQQPADVVALALPFFKVLAFSIIPVSFFFVCKQYCEGHGDTKPSMYISIGGNLLNILLNYVFITGSFGFPEMGYMGSAWATFCARVFMGLAFLIYIFSTKKVHPGKAIYRSAVINAGQLKKLFVMGLGSGAQLTFEVAAFVIAGLMCGVFGKEAIDAHGISLSMAAFTYMFASGVSGAATIRIGQLHSAGDTEGTFQAGMAAFRIVFVVMTIFGLIFLSFHQWLPYGFTSSDTVALMSSRLLMIAALFQLFDGIQAAGLGILRGMEDVRYPTLITLIGYWGIALPLAYVLAFKTSLGIYGVWFSLCVSLMFVASSLYLRFKKLAKKETPQ